MYTANNSNKDHKLAQMPKGLPHELKRSRYLTSQYMFRKSTSINKINVKTLPVSQCASSAFPAREAK